MVGGDHHQILLPQPGQELSQPGVKLRQCLRVAVNVPAVAVEHVKIHQVHKAQTVEILPGVVHGMVHTVSVALVEHMLRGALTGKNIVDLAHSDGIQPGGLDGVQHGGCGRLQGEVMPVTGPPEAVHRISHKGTGDDPAHAVLSPEDASGLAAGVVKLLQGDLLLMGRHLEHRVGGGIEDPLAGIQLLLAVIPDHVGAGIGQVAQPAPAGGRLKGVQHLFRKALGIGGQRVRGHHTRDLPVADGGILTHGGLRQPGHGSGGSGGLGQTVHPVDAA